MLKRGNTHRLGLKSRWSRTEIRAFAVADVAPPAKRRNLTQSGYKAERGKLVSLLKGKASREASRWICGYGIVEKANAVL